MRIEGNCPMGCGETLEVDVGVYAPTVMCGNEEHCPNPGAVTDILYEDEVDHIVFFTDGGYNVKHPLKERINDELLTCTEGGWLADLSGPPAAPGKYRLSVGEQGLENLERIHE